MIPPIHLINKEGRLGITEETGSYLAQSKFVNTNTQKPMNTQLIDQIKALKGVKEVTMVNDMAVVVFEPRKLVFTTEDGVDIFSGDRYWIVNKITHSITTISANEMMLSADVLRFSTPESAQKWIDEQKNPKPIYTDPDDGTEFFEGDEGYWFGKQSYDILSRYINRGFSFIEDSSTSKIYKSRQLCELALAKFIMDKYTTPDHV